MNKEIQVEEINEELPKLKEDYEQQAEVILENNNENQNEENEENELALKIKEDIRRREAEIEEIKNTLNRIYQHEPQEHVDLYNRLDKVMWDRQMESEKRKINSNSLESQILQKQKLKTIEEVEKEKERSTRLYMINQVKKDEMQERLDAISKANKYREELNIQAALQKQIHDIEQFQYKAPIPRPKENPPPQRYTEGISPINSKNERGKYQNYSPEKYYSSNIFQFTKKAPKTLIFNPITGELKDTSMIEQRSFSYLKGRNMSPEPKIIHLIDEDRNRSHFLGAGNYIVKGRQSP